MLKDMTHTLEQLDPHKRLTTEESLLLLYLFKSSNKSLDNPLQTLDSILRNRCTECNVKLDNHYNTLQTLNGLSFCSTSCSVTFEDTLFLCNDSHKILALKNSIIKKLL